MRSLRLPCLAVLLCAAGTAFAQAQPAPNAAPAHLGPFPPQPGDDPSLFRTLPPEAYVQPPPVAAAGTQATAAPQRNANPPASPVVVVVPDTRDAMQEQLERARVEAEAARARMNPAPAPINGAFTGLTDERDR